MDLGTTYLGFKLSNPFMPGASPLVDDLDMVRRLEDAGASAIVMHSLFQEQHPGSAGGSSSGRGATPATDFALDPAQYLEQIRRIKGAVAVPVIASLNGTMVDSWLEWARSIEQAGADALELNIYYLAADPLESSAEVDRRVVHIARRVRAMVSIPVAVKLSVFISGVAHLANELDTLGIQGLVLFNRFYQPDIDIETRRVVPRLRLSDSSELLVRLRWTASLSPQVRCGLAVSGGVHTVEDAVKALMAGASAIQVVSCLLQRGPEYLVPLREGLAAWLEANGHDRLDGIQGSLNHRLSPDPGEFERANYTRILQGPRN
ncbi:MAG TPA: dihydroorotate dehydrogenase-like protein [Candidatus Eisenbacteria bacterium]